MPLAFSVHNFISSVGADAGFAAIIGLAVLILLYFAHARETANLREEASILAERLQQAEARVAELRQAQPVSAAVPAAEGVQVTDRRGTAVPELPFAPAGVGAPALAAATRVVPLVEPPPPASAPASAPAPALAVAAASTSRPAAAASTAAPTSKPAAAASTAAPTSPGARASGPPPASAAPAVPRPATTAGANGGGRGPGTPLSERPAARPAPVGLPPLGEPAKARGGVGRRVAVILAALVLVAAAVVALVVVTRSNSSSGPTSARQTPTTNAPTTQSAPAFSPASVTVAVLNGTATNQLAHRVAAKLGSSGYRKGAVATAATQTQTATVVAYLPGAKNRADALHVANALSLKPAAVQPIDQATRQVACPGPGACSANVVVTVGSDLATLS
jgi:LytR cell envelope-related transcriptional attenuator